MGCGSVFSKEQAGCEVMEDNLFGRQLNRPAARTKGIARASPSIPHAAHCGAIVLTAADLLLLSTCDLF